MCSSDFFQALRCLSCFSYSSKLCIRISSLAFFLYKHITALYNISCLHFYSIQICYLIITLYYRTGRINYTSLFCGQLFANDTRCIHRCQPSRIRRDSPALSSDVPRSREISRCPAFLENGIIFFFVADYSTCLPRNATK